MRKLKNALKICALILVGAAVLSGCKKSATDPDAALKASIQKYVINSTASTEADLIAEWLDTMRKNQENLQTTSTGINYIPIKTGEGATVKAGDSLTVKYVGFFMNGSILDASDYHGGTFKYVHKTDSMIKGWEEGIEVLNKGASAVFLIPSAKGYGTTGHGPVAPNTPLIFVIEVLDIK